MDCLNHPWFERSTLVHDFKLSTATLTKIDCFKKANNFKQAVIYYIAYRQQNTEMKKYQAIYSELTTQENGFIDRAVFDKVIGDHFNPEEKDRLFKACDLNDDGKI